MHVVGNGNNNYLFLYQSLLDCFVLLHCVDKNIVVWWRQSLLLAAGICVCCAIFALLLFTIVVAGVLRR